MEDMKSECIKKQLNTQLLTPLQWRGIMKAMEEYANERIKKPIEALKKVQLQVGQIEHNWDYREKTYMPFVIKAIKESI